MPMNPIPWTATDAPPPTSRRDEIDLPTAAGILADRKWTVLAGTGAVVLAALLYLLVATPQYESSAVVQVQRAPSAVPGVSLQSMNPITVPESSASTEVQLLASRRVLGDAVEALNLDVQVEPKRVPVIGDALARLHRNTGADAPAQPWMGLESFGWGGERLRIARLDVPAHLQGQPLELTAGRDGAYTLRGPDGRTLLQGRVGAPAQGEGIAMQVAALRANAGTRFEVTRHDTLAVVDALRREVTVSEQGRDSGVLSLRYLHPDPQQALAVMQQITAAYMRQNEARNSADAARRLEFVREQLPKVEAELARRQQALNDFQTRHRTLDVTAQNQALLSQILALDNSIQQLRLQQAQVAGRYTAGHPQHRALLQQIGRFESQKASLQAQMNQLPDTQEGLFRLNRDLEVTNRTYANLLDQAQQLDIARASAVGNARIVDPAAVKSDEPATPRPLPILLGATLLGALLSIGYVLLRHALKRGIEDPADIERVGLPVYAAVPFSERGRLVGPAPRGQSHLLALKAPADPTMEALRMLRTNLMFSRFNARNNVLMVAAPCAGVGKTFLCANLAVTIAQTGQRVLLIDADMRRGTVHQAFGGSPEGGLAELLAGHAKLDAVLREVPGVDNLSFIARGDIPANPSELLMHPAFSALLKMVGPRYDAVIIDTPPVLAVTDASVIGPHAGTCLLVVRQGMNSPREIDTARQRLERNGIEVSGVIFNGVTGRSAMRNGYAPHAYGSEQPKRLPRVLSATS